MGYVPGWRRQEKGELRNKLLVLARRGVHENRRKKRKAKKEKKKRRYPPGWEQQQNKRECHASRGAKYGRVKEDRRRNKESYGRKQSRLRKMERATDRLARGFDGLNGKIESGAARD